MQGEKRKEQDNLFDKQKWYLIQKKKASRHANTYN